MTYVDSDDDDDNEIDADNDELVGCDLCLMGIGNYWQLTSLVRLLTSYNKTTFFIIIIIIIIVHLSNSMMRRVGIVSEPGL